jgi:hypothetical protein
MHCFYPRGLLPVQFAVGETLEIRKLDYPALRVDFSGDEANPTQYGVFAELLRQHVHVMHAVQYRNNDRLLPDCGREIVYRGGKVVAFYAQKDNVERGRDLSCGYRFGSNTEIAMRWAENL